MILKNITEKLKTVLSLAISSMGGRAILFHALWKMVQSFIACQLARLFKRDLNHRRVPTRRLDELELWNSFSYYPTVTHWDILSAASGKYIGKDKKWHHGEYLIYS